MATLLVTLLVTILATVSAEAKHALPVALLEADSILATLGVFETGNVATANFSVKTSDSASPPRPLLIVTPTVNGTYPVILFHHGTYLRNSFYSDLFKHISSHGYIIVAPQFYELIIPSGPTELELAAKVANWLPSGLRSVLPENVEADLDNLALGGHSRGGKIAFALALGYAKTPLKVKFSALIGLDPVAGSSKESHIEPKILTYVARSFNLSIPVTVIGTGLGDEGQSFLMPACAPKGVNHEEFFYECRPPSSHFVTTDYGHMDMLNDDLGAFGPIADFMCKSGTGSKELMRRTVGGIIVSFLKAYFEGEKGDYMTILEEPSVAPAKLDPVQLLGAQSLLKSNARVLQALFSVLE